MRFRIFFNDTFSENKEVLNDDHVYHLFAEYFSRVLLHAHNKLDDFRTTAFASPQELIKAVLEVIGEDGGLIPGAMEHFCLECTHRKRRGRNSQTGGEIPVDDLIGVAEPQVPGGTVIDEDEGSDTELFVKAAVMDGKTITHKVKWIVNGTV